MAATYANEFVTSLCKPSIGLLLDHIPVSSVPRATVRTLKPKILKKTKNLNPFFKKNLRFFQTCLIHKHVHVAEWLTTRHEIKEVTWLEVACQL